MFFAEFLTSAEGKNISYLNPKKVNFNVIYNIWRENLFERAMRLFVWNTGGEVEQKEIEQRLLLQGYCGITRYKERLTAFFGSLSTPTVYYDEFEYMNVSSPTYSARLKLESEIVLIDNNAVRNSIYPLVHNYAMMLAHNDITIINMLVNMRENNVATASTEKERVVLTQYRCNLYNGTPTPILDPAFRMSKFVEVGDAKKADIMDLVECRQNLLNSFYADIGVKTSWNKRGNMIREEVNGNDTMLLINIKDMLASRKKGCERVNALYGTSWSVELAPELEYDDRTEDDANVQH